MNEHIYTEALIKQYLSLCKPKCVEPDMTVEEYLSIRKQALWEYAHYSFSTKDDQITPKNFNRFQGSGIIHNSPTEIKLQQETSAFPFDRKNDSSSQLKNTTFEKEEKSNINKDNSKNKEPTVVDDAVRIFKSLGE